MQPGKVPSNNPVKEKRVSATIVTPEDLEDFRLRLLEDIKTLLAEKYQKPHRRWIKSHEVQRILTASPAKLQRLREAGKLPYTLIGRVIYYDYEDIEAMLLKNKQQQQNKAYLFGSLSNKNNGSNQP